MEDIVEQKGIEKSEPVSEPVISEVKERKPRTEAQKAAFEKARKKRAENLAKKKAQEAIEYTEAGSSEEEEVKPKPAPKKRGRPKGSRKLKREPVPEPGTFLPQNIPPEAGDIRYGYHQPQPQFNPWAFQQQPPAPQVHNYYYGHQQGAVNQAPEPAPAPAPQAAVEHFEPDSPVYQDESESSEEDERDYLPPPDPRLKFKFG
tara:strand:- start:1846 stop:2454 length:609 start_codon:yes stop_codon:yes gene_type:complete